jgi:hypothetical protein
MDETKTEIHDGSLGESFGEVSGDSGGSSSGAGFL